MAAFSPTFALDSHNHFWKYDPAQHTWMTDQMEVLKHEFLPEDFKPLLQKAGFDGSIAVQARQSLEETEWLLNLAEKYDFIKGVVGWVDLQSPKVGEQLRKYPTHPKLVGVRHVVHDEPDDNFMLRPEFVQGLAQLQDSGSGYDLCYFQSTCPWLWSLLKSFRSSDS